MTAYFRPLVRSEPTRPDDALPVAGTRRWFSHALRLERGQPQRIVPVADIPQDTRDAISVPRAPICGLTLDRPQL